MSKLPIFECSFGYPIYKLSWSSVSSEQHYQLAFSSFVVGEGNKFGIIDILSDGSKPSIRTTSTSLEYPVTKHLWNPDKTRPNIISTTGDGLRIWDIANSDENSYSSSFAPDVYSSTSDVVTMKETLIQKAYLVNSRTKLGVREEKEVCAPLTSMDWNEVDSNLIITSSIDTTCSVWNVEACKSVTQLIAHDKEVYDVAFSYRSAHIFASVGADGSVRTFDLRALQHSTIMYENPDGDALMQVCWNQQDSNYLATFASDSKRIIILDVRFPCGAVVELDSPTGNINSISWGKAENNSLFCGDDSGRLHEWISEGRLENGQQRFTQNKNRLHLELEDSVGSFCLSSFGIACSSANCLYVVQI